MKSLADMQAFLAEQELAAMRTQLETKKTELEMNGEVLKAERATILYKLECLKADSDATKDTATAKSNAENAWTTAATKTTDYFTQAQADAAKSILGSYSSAFAGIADVWNKVIYKINKGKQ